MKCNNSRNKNISEEQIRLKSKNIGNNKVIAGIDVGLKKSPVCIIYENKIRFFGDVEDILNKKIDYAGIDAPLSIPEGKSYRDFEKELLKMGIRLFPSGSKFFKKVGLKGIEIAERLQKRGVMVFEVYPYATRVFLGLAPKAKKRTKKGLMKIINDIEKKFGFRIPDDFAGIDHNHVDALISAITVKLYVEGRGRILRGEDGEILIPEV